MKILLVAPQSKDTVLGTIGGHCKKALINLGYEIETFDFRQSQYLRNPIGSFFKKGIKKIFPFSARQIPFIDTIEREKMNGSLLATVKKYRPDILLVLMGDTIFPETLGRIKELGIITVNWFHDTVLARKDFVQGISYYYDYFFIIDSEEVLNYVKISSSHVKSLPLACNPQVHKSIDLAQEEKREYGNEVCFVGTVKFKRKEILSHLTDFDLGIWGYWLEKSPELKKCYRRQHVYGEEAVKIYNASKIVLDIPILYGTGDKIFYVTPRVFEVPACGAFLLTAENFSLSNLYETGKEIVCYKDENELKVLIRYYLKHPEERTRIAQKGQERAHRDHTYEKRLKKIFSIIEKNSH